LHFAPRYRSAKTFVVAPANRLRRADYFRHRAALALPVIAEPPHGRPHLHWVAMSVVARVPELANRERHCGLAPLPDSIRLQAAARCRPLRCPAHRPSRLHAAAVLPACRRHLQASTESAAARGCRHWAEDYFLSPLIQFTGRNFQAACST
jgi:hypothetical protein